MYRMPVILDDVTRSSSARPFSARAGYLRGLADD